MHASTIALIAIAAAGPIAAQLCPSANGLFYQGPSRAWYQVQWDIEYWTQTNLGNSSIADPVACGRACDSWTSANPTKPCAAGSWEKSTRLCYLKPGDLNAQRRNNANVVSLILTPPA